MFTLRKSRIYLRKKGDYPPIEGHTGWRCTAGTRRNPRTIISGLAPSLVNAR
jgi:hypothetical protein